MTEVDKKSRWRQFIRGLNDSVYRELPVLVFSAILQLVVGLLILNWAWVNADVNLRRAGVAVCVASLLLLGLLLWREAWYRRGQHRWLVRYTEDLRHYAVSNIEPLRQTIDALHNVQAPQPPPEVPNERSEADDRPLSTKERNTLLAMIALLCKEARIDYTRPAQAAAVIKSAADLQGIGIGETTIEQHLKRIPGALESRSK